VRLEDAVQFLWGVRVKQGGASSEGLPGVLALFACLIVSAFLHFGAGNSAHGGVHQQLQQLATTVLCAVTRSEQQQVSTVGTR